MGQYVMHMFVLLALFSFGAIVFCQDTEDAGIDIKELFDAARNESQIIYHRYLLSSAKWLPGTVLYTDIKHDLDLSKLITEGKAFKYKGPSEQREPDYESAIEKYRKVIETGEQTFIKDTYRMSMLRQSGDPLPSMIEALGLLSAHLRAHPTRLSDMARVECAICFLKSDKKKEARELLKPLCDGFAQRETRVADETIRKKIPQELEFTRPDEAAVFLLANELSEHKEYDQAIKLCEMLQSTVTNSFVAFNSFDLLALVYKAQGKHEEAKRVLGSRIEMVRKNWPIYLGGNASLSEFQENEKGKFIELLEKDIQNLRRSGTPKDKPSEVPKSEKSERQGTGSEQKAKVEEEPLPTDEAKPVDEPTQVQSEPTSNWLMHSLIVAAVVIVGLVVFLLIRKRKSIP